MTGITAEELAKVNSFPRLVELLRDKLEWPIPEDYGLEDVVFEYEPHELGLKDELDKINASSIEDWVSQVVNLLKGKNLYFFLKGTEEEYNGKTIVKLSLPKYKFAAADEAKLDKFDKTNQYHYKAMQTKAVSSFEPANDDFEM